MTRDLGQLQQLVADVAAMRQEAAAAAEHSEGRWAALLDMVDRRLQDYQAECGAVAQIQAAASSHDRRASVLTTRARLVLHRYVRHFAGRPRRGRDLARMAEIRSALLELFDALRPLAGAIHTRSVAEEIGAVGGFLDFFAAEQAELERARDSGSLLDRSQTLQDMLVVLEQGWQREVVAVDRLLRRPGLVQRYIAGLDGVLEGLMQVRHANLPDHHELATQRAAALLGRWQDELVAVQQARQLCAATTLIDQLLDHASALAEPWLQDRAPWTAAERQWLGDLADALDEAEQQVAALASEGLEARLALRWAWLRDVLVGVERDYDSTAT